MMSTTSRDSAFCKSVMSCAPRNTFILKIPFNSSEDRCLMSNRFSKFGRVSFGDLVMLFPFSDVMLTENFGIQ